MNIRVIQPPYPHNVEDTPAAVAFMIDQLHQCDDSLDLILLPECCNAPSGCGDASLLKRLVAENTEPLLTAVRETAVRCNAVVGINLYVYGEAHPNTVRNATQLYNRKGELAAQYDKIHLPRSEYINVNIDHDYIEDLTGVTVAEVDGIRYCFLTCYDVYFTEQVNRIAVEHPDIVLVCSLQRGERHDMLELQGKNIAFMTNAYVVRSSYYMGPGAKTGSCSMVVDPEGKVMQNYGNELGHFDVTVDDIKYKYYRSNGYGQPPVTNYVYQTFYRAPWTYRASGSGVRNNDFLMPFPRMGSVGGYALAAPEGTVPAVALAVSMGASEVELKVRACADGTPVVSACECVEKMTAEEAKAAKVGEGAFDGIGFATVEDIMARFPRRTILNLHILPSEGCDYAALISKIMTLAVHYDCHEHIYFTSECKCVLKAAAEAAPEAARCLIGTDVAAAAELGCNRVQLCTECVSEGVIAKAHEAGLKVNVVASGEAAKTWLAAGADCILTNAYLADSRVLGIK